MSNQGPAAPGQNFEVELPAGGRMFLQSAEEVELWNKSRDRYIDDYHLTNVNDLHLLGAILQQQIAMFRAQRGLNGMKPELDNMNVPTGRYVQFQPDSDDEDKHTSRLNKATSEIRNLEKALGIDKVTRESGGQMSVANYLRTLKHAAHERGIHISKRVIAYEGFVNELRTRLRILKNADAEDRQYHGISEASIIEWARDELDQLLEVDKKFARERGKMFVGKL